MTEPTHLTPVHAAALAFADAGCSVVPARPDGSKAPVGDWKRWQHERAGEAQIRQWLWDDHPGLGLVCGAVSGGLLLVELEGRAVKAGMLETAAHTAVQAGDGQLWHDILNGYVEWTPSGGLHILYRIGDHPAPGNQKLARRPGPTPNTVEVLAETRGEGGYVVVAPSGGTTHPTGKPWVALTGTPASIPTITYDEHIRICSILRSLDQMPSQDIDPDARYQIGVGRISNDLTPGDDFNRRHTWADVLGPHDWRAIRARGQVVDWCRPGKQHGISATTGYGEHDLLYVFSTSTVFDSERSYSKFAAYALLEHGGSFADAARQLRKEGYGAPRDPLPPLLPFTPDLPSGAHQQVASMAAEAATGIAADTAVAPDGTTDPLAGRRLQLETNEYEQIRARDIARRRYDAEQVARDFREPAMRSLADELALPDEDVLYRIDQVMPIGANVVLTAKYKTGKTTTIGQLARVLADGGRFLHKFPVTPIPDGRTVCIFNYELSEGQYRRWLRDLGIANQAAVSVVHLRGITLPLTQQWAQDKVCGWLERFQAAVWVVDPFARAMTGSGDENANRDVGEFVAILDDIKRRTGVGELVMPAHTGRGNDTGDRARGATRLNDWADVQWLLTKNDQNTRFFSADGRDVDVAEEKLTYDDASRSYVMAGGDKQWESDRDDEESVWNAVKASEGIKAKDIEDATGLSHRRFSKARDSLKFLGYISTEADGTSTRHYTGKVYTRAR